jgi:hypothetical protein
MADIPDFDLSAFWQEPDFLLTDLVSLMANKADSQMGITLMVKGAIMTGVLVGEREYLRRVNEMFKRMARESITKPTKEDLAEIDESFGFDEMIEDNYPPDDAEEDEDAPTDAAPIRHLHLKDPVIIYPGSTLSFMESALPILRIRLAAVDGWMLGRISMISEDDEDDLPDVGFIH